MRLARRRYGGVGRSEETERRVREVLARDHWDEERWHRFLRERRREMLRHAASSVPHYRELWRRRDGDVERLEDWPVLEKAELRRAPERFVAEGSPRLFREATSGTTGTPLRLFRSVATERAWYALLEARSRRWYGVDRQQPWALFGGRLVTPPERREPPFWVWNAGLRQLYLSSYHLSPRTARPYLDAMARRGVRHVYAYPSAIHALARAVLDSGAGTVSRALSLGLRVVVTQAEPLLAAQRRDVEEAFGAPVRETWGMAELVAAAGECEHGSLHLWPEVGVVEVDEGGETGEGAGDVIATTLLARDQPLIRYRLGDRLAGDPGPPGRVACGCGRTLPVLPPLEGRTDDVLILPGGRRIGRLDPVFKGDLPLVEAQIVQETPTRIRLRYVPAPGWSPRHEDELRRRLKDRLGAAQGPGDGLDLRLDAVSSIPREASGKFRAVVSRISGEPPGPSDASEASEPPEASEASEAS